MKISIAYITGRKDPHWQWFVDSLCAQLDGRVENQVARDSIEVVFVDGKLWSTEEIEMMGAGAIDITNPLFHDPERHEQLDEIIHARLGYRHLPPKPCAMQGPFRLTRKDFFCASNTRNTAIIAAKHPYLVCVDDLSVLTPGWLDQVRHAAEHGYCVAGAYKKVKKLSVEDGIVAEYDPYPEGMDSRWAAGSDTGIVPWHGNSLFGCSFGVPIEAALAIDGFEPACNGEGCEDSDFGIRLERSGAKIFYNRNMLTLESEEWHHRDVVRLAKGRKLVLKDRVPQGYLKYKMPNVEEAYYSDHVLINRVVNETKRVLPLFPEGLRDLRTQFLKTGKLPVPAGPMEDWRDGRPLSEL